MMTADEVRRLIRGMLNEPGSAPITQKDFAAAAGVTQAFLSDVLRGRREPSGKLLDHIGLLRVVTYEPNPCRFNFCKFCDGSGDCRKVAFTAPLEQPHQQFAAQDPSTTKGTP